MIVSGRLHEYSQDHTARRISHSSQGFNITSKERAETAENIGDINIKTHPKQVADLRR